MERKFYQVTTSDDPILKELREKKTGTIYATDAIFTTLMTALKSVYSWDLIVRKKGTSLNFEPV